MIKNIVYSILFVVLPACKGVEPQIKKDANGVVISKPALWITPTSANNHGVISITNNAVWNNTVVVSGWNGVEQGLIGINSANGKKRWEWYDDLGNFEMYCYHNFIFENKLCWEKGRELYCIDMQTGGTLIKKRYEYDPYLRSVTGNGDAIYVVAESHAPAADGTPNNARLYKTSVIENGVLTEIAEPAHSGIVDLNNNLSDGGMSTVVVRNGHELVLFSTLEKSEDDASLYGGKGFIHLFDASDNTWVYQQVLFIDDVSSMLQKKPGVWGNFVYLVMNDWVICTDLMSGNVIWSKQFNYVHFAFGGYYIAEKEGLLLVQAEGNGTILYALDLETGKEVWKEPTSGSSTEMQYLNGIVYFVGGGDGWLHAVEVETGKHLWKIVAPNDYSHGDFFSSYCAVVPGVGNKKGTVIPASELNAFGYEAIR